MSDHELTPGQKNILTTLRRLRDADLHAAEPAGVFRPTTWASGSVPGFDLAAIAAGPEAATQSPPVDGKPMVPTGDLPPPCGTVAEIVQSVGAGNSTAMDIAEAAERRVAACDPAINAFITPSIERARREATAVDEVVAAGERPRPLAGVPLAHKDIIATRDIRTTAGSAMLRDYLPAEDASVVARLTNAGTTLIGKTNTHQFATGTTGAVSEFGAVRNPWDLERISGGSSSGAAAALAAGMVAAATGTDTGGSIRIPSACCGVVGLKPTYGRVSRSGVLPFAWGLDHIGPMARRVRDVAMLLTAMAGPDPYDRASAGDASGDFVATLDEGVQGLRIGVPGPWFLDLATAPVVQAVRDAAETLERLGAQRVDVEMPAQLDLVGPAAIAIFLAEGGAVHARTLVSHPHGYLPATRSFLGLHDQVAATDYLHAQRVRALLCDAMARLFQGTDLLVLPTLPIVAPRLDEDEVPGPDGPLDVRAALTLFTRPFNLTGLPALSLPCGFHDGLPIGLQLVGRPFDEATVLRAGHAYEDATEWHAARPPLFP